MEKNKKTNLKSKILPLILTVIVIALDQITKTLIAKNIPINTIGFSFWNEFLRIVHVSNTGVAFSVGATWSETLRHVCFNLVPVVVIILVLVVYFRNNDFSKLQRWAIAGIVGGGIGNLIDRFARSEGVVDFIDVKFFGIFGLNRWPTFNIADSAVVVCGIMLIISFIVTSVKNSKKKDEDENSKKSE